MIDNSESESDSISMISESSNSVGHCLDVQDEIIDTLQNELK